MTRGSAFALSALAVAALGACDDGATRSASATDDDGSAVATTFRFTDVSANSGVTFVARTADDQKYIPEAKGGGVALFDQDGDGILDLALVAGSTTERSARGEPGFGMAFYRGLGGCRFRDATSEVGLGGPMPWLSAPVAGDVDGDGRPDLLLTGPDGARLFLNDGTRFRDVTESALPASARTGWCTSAVFVDLDGDDDLDVYLCRYAAFDPKRPPRDGESGRSCRHRGRPVLCGPRGLVALADVALVNRGDGVFADATSLLGFDALRPSYGLGALLLDFDADGRIDVFVANDATPNRLWRNEGGRFKEVGESLGVAWSADGTPEAGMGVDAADLNGDGVEDFVVTNFESEANSVYLSSQRLGWVESSARVRTGGVDRPHVGWGVGIRDFDGDGLSDVFVANGHVYAGFDEGAPWRQPSVLHLGREDGSFSRLTGPAASALDVPRPSRAAAFGDLDDDGDTDVVVVNMNGPPTILRADLPPGLAWCGLVVRGPAKNRAALGARATLDGSTPRRFATVRAQASIQATNDARVIFRFRTPPTEAPEVVVELGNRRAKAALKLGSYSTVSIGD